MAVSKWALTTIGEQATLQRGFDITQKEQRPGHVPVISSGGISSFHDTAVVKGPGVIIGRKGALGTVFYVKEDYWPHDTTLWVKDFHGNDPRFVYYFFKSLKVMHLDVGSANPTLNRNHVHPIEVLWPPLPEQRAIAHILGTLDNKIELNQRMNETLEAMARALFKSWFVDFEPVRAKAKGRQPVGMDAETAALFPERFVDTQRDVVPEGWRKSTIGNELPTVLGGTPSRDNLSFWSHGTVGWINSGKANEFRIVEPSELITEEAVARSATKLLPARTTVIAITGATLGKVSLLEIPCCANQSIVGVLGTDALPSEYVYFWVKHIIDDLVSWQTGGAQQHINKDNVNQGWLLVPSQQVIDRYLGIASPLFDRVKANCLESQNLVAVRDTFLPKLLSGEIRVKDAEHVVEEVLA